MKITSTITIFFFIALANILSQSFVSINEYDISQSGLKRHIEVLGSDLFEGRGTGTKGSKLAASYISAVFGSINLKPIGDDESFFQSVPLHGTKYLDSSKLTLSIKNEVLELKIGEDYLLSNSGEQTIIPVASELVFVGYGIIAPEFDHNDYLEKDIVGKIVVMLAGEPESQVKEYFNGDEPTIYSHADIKHRVAISRGAAGTALIPPSNIENEEWWNRLVSEYSFEDVQLSYNATNNFGIVLNPKVAKKLFKNEMIDFNSELDCDNTKAGKCKIKFEGQFIVRDFRAKNVVALLEAPNNENDEYVIVSAHYDHLGIGSEVNGDSIYNGVLDNAMGVASMLEIAKYLKNNEEYLTRSVLFIATTAEEKGLLGSSYYVDHPIFPLYKTVANINIDGVAYLDIFKSIIGIGAELSDLSTHLSLMANKFNYTLGEIPKEFYSNEAFNRSDQIAFAKGGIPSVLILDSPDYVNLDRESAIKKMIHYNQNVYHTPFDDLNIEINYDAALMHSEFLASFILDVSSSKEEISWKKNVPYNFMRLQTKAEKR